MKDYLYLHTRDLPYFRALLRAVESRFYQDLDLPSPTLDLGCGDGHFAQLTFDRKLEAGVDPRTGPVREARARGVYGEVIEADGANMPYPDAYFSSALSNSALEHIPHLDGVLAETARVLKPGAPFVFSVPNQNFLPSLSFARFLDAIGLKPLAAAYRAFFNTISRHETCENPEQWTKRLEAAGFKVERYWHYFSPAALAAFEWGHYLGLPSLVIHFLTGKWRLTGSRWKVAPITALIRKYYEEPVPQENGGYTFYVTRRV
ncbi:MAG: class I SAM-dependent methyltransferase [Deltaproteobacteria bacterium]|nr:class I SAM-dependent methyltransferase [Deltaproteobacteria bacterium]